MPRALTARPLRPGPTASTPRLRRPFGFQGLTRRGRVAGRARAARGNPTLAAARAPPPASRSTARAASAPGGAGRCGCAANASGAAVPGRGLRRANARLRPRPSPCPLRIMSRASPPGCMSGKPPHRRSAPAALRRACGAPPGDGRGVEMWGQARPPAATLWGASLWGASSRITPRSISRARAPAQLAPEIAPSSRPKETPGEGTPGAGWAWARPPFTVLLGQLPAPVMEATTFATAVG